MRLGITHDLGQSLATLPFFIIDAPKHESRAKQGFLQAKQNRQSRLAGFSLDMTCSQWITLFVIRE
jgi:hypothetical protein